MVRLKVCPCFRLSGYEEFMELVANRTMGCVAGYK
jgi:hypothetical protein